jgi:hypothetical protein
MVQEEDEGVGKPHSVDVDGTEHRNERVGNRCPKLPDEGAHCELGCEPSAYGNDEKVDDIGQGANHVTLVSPPLPRTQQ